MSPTDQRLVNEIDDDQPDSDVSAFIERMKAEVFRAGLEPLKVMQLFRKINEIFAMSSNATITCKRWIGSPGSDRGDDGERSGD